METIRSLYLQWTKVALSLTLLAGLYLVILGPEFLAAWMGREEFGDRAGMVLQILMVSCFFFMPIRGVSLGFLMGLGNARRPGLLFLAMGLANLGLSLILVQHYGIFGVALGTAIPNVVFAFLIAALVCRDIHLPLWTFALHVGGRALIGALPVALLLLWMKHGLHPESFFLLVTLGVLHVAVFVAVWVAFVYRNDPHIDAWSRLRRLLRR
jgi:O-antigen/teichoic acid export membrane protein